MATWLTYNTDDGAAPREAAVLILYNQESGTVLLAKRNPTLAFMGGHFSFPGGRLSKFDTGRCVQNAADSETGRYLTAAVRETFEETGVLLVHGNTLPPEQISQVRQRILEAPEEFESFLEAENLRIDMGEFFAAGRWITPSFSPLRFDTRYFLHIVKEPLPTATPIGPKGEITEVYWVTPQEALRQRSEGLILLSTPPTFVLQRLATFPLNEALERLQHTPGTSDTLMEYIEPLPGIHIVPVKTKTLPPATHTNCVIIGQTELAIFDPGIHDETERDRFLIHLEAIAEGVGGRPTVIVLTHSHLDHCAFAPSLAKRFDIPIYGRPSAVIPHVDRILHDGDLLPLAGTPPWSIHCCYTPGHHPDHFCFFEQLTNTLICGDMIANPGTIMINPDAGGDMDAYLKSLERLAMLNPHLTIPGHGAPLQGEQGLHVINGTHAHRLMREEKIRTAFDSGAKTIDHLLALAYDDTPPELYPLAEKQLRAHLIRLNISISS